MNKTLSIIKYILAYLFIGLAMGSYFPTLSLYLLKELKLENYEIGIIISIIPLIPIFVLPIWGIYTDKIKSPKKSLLISVFFSSILIFLLIYINSFIIFLLVISLFMVFKAPIFSLYDEILIGECKKYNINYGTFRAACSVGFSVATFIIIYFSNIFGSKISFIITSIFLLIVGILIFFSEDTDYKEKESLNIKMDIPLLLKNKFYIYLCIIIAITYGVLDSNLVYMSSYLVKLTNTEQYIDIAVFLSVFLEVFIIYFAKMIYRYTNLKTILLFINIISFIRYSIIFIAPNTFTILLLAPVHAITFGLSYPIAIQFISDKVSKKALATGYALFAALISLSTSLISFTAGILIDINVLYIFILFLSLSLLNSIIIVICLRKYNYSVNTV